MTLKCSYLGNRLLSVDINILILDTGNDVHIKRYQALWNKAGHYYMLYDIKKPPWNPEQKYMSCEIHIDLQCKFRFLGGARDALTQVEGEVDRIWVLDPIEHGLALPPRRLLVPVEVRQEAGVVAQLRVRRVAVVAGARGARLHAVVLGGGAAHVGRLHRVIEGDVLELGQAAAGEAVLIVAGVHRGPDKEVAVEMKGEQKGREKRSRSRGCIHVCEHLKIPFTLHTDTLMYFDTEMWRHKGPDLIEMPQRQREEEVQSAQSFVPLLCLHVLPLVKCPTCVLPMCTGMKLVQELSRSSMTWDRGGTGRGGGWLVWRVPKKIKETPKLLHLLVNPSNAPALDVKETWVK